MFRLMAAASAAALPCTSWVRASLHFLGRPPVPNSGAAYRTLARNGIRRFCLADPMTEAAAERRERAPGPAGGGLNS